jgi:hypothetical protein
VTIPGGLVLRTTAGDVTFEVAEQRTLQRGQARVDVPVRAATGFEGAAGVVGPGLITSIATPLLGIDHIANVEATVLGAADETDEVLRQRARAAVLGVGKGTLAAILAAVAAENTTVVEVWDPEITARPTPPGTMTLLVEAEPERFPGVVAAVHETRAAGIAATVVARFVYVTPRLALRLSPGVPATAHPAVVDAVIAAVQAVVDSLGAGEPLTGAALLAAAQQVTGVATARVADVLTWRADVNRPGPQTLVDAVLGAVATAAGDEALLRTAVTDLLTGTAAAPPTAGRVPDRSLVQGPDGAPATDDEIAAGTFSVLTPTDGTWWLALDLTATDVGVS